MCKNKSTNKTGNNDSVLMTAYWKNCSERNDYSWETVKEGTTKNDKKKIYHHNERKTKREDEETQVALRVYKKGMLYAISFLTEWDADTGWNH